MMTSFNYTEHERDHNIDAVTKIEIIPTILQCELKIFWDSYLSRISSD